MAEILADCTGADLYEIVPKIPYEKAELKWNDKNSRTTREMNTPGFRPEIANAPIDVSAYHNMDDLIEVCVNNMASDAFPPEQARIYMRDLLPKLGYWKNRTNLAGAEAFEAFKKQLIDEINALHIEGMPKLETLNALVGGYINLEYRLPNGSKVKFLDDSATYLGNQLESTLESGRCFGIAANADFLLVCTYGENGENPELVVYKKR